MKLVTYNIQYSLGRDGRFDLARCVREVEGADVIALQEVERHWRRTGMRDQPAEIGAMLPHHHWVYGPYFEVAASDPGPAGARPGNRRRQFGNMVLSRHPIVSSRLVIFPKHHHPERFNMLMGALDTVVDAPGAALRVWSIHLGYLEPRERLEHLECLFDVQRRGDSDGGAWSGPGAIREDDWSDGAPAPPAPRATVWMGDFNSMPDSEEYAHVTSPGGGRVGMLDGWTLAGNDRDGGPTHLGRAHREKSTGRRIDYCFVSPELASAVVGARVDLDARGSDHQPVWTEIRDA